MRFNADGPIIPDSLLRERDAGRVVFLCGAGVSVPAEMPTFVRLTELVIRDLAPAEESDIVQAFEPWINADTIIPERARMSLDQIFNMLQQEYGKDQVGKLVTKHLGIDEPTSVDSNQHKIIARISSSHEGIPQIVTTNFDHLFEHAFDGDPIRYYGLCCKLGEGAMRNQGASCSPYDSALARRSCSHAMASVRAHGPRSKARSTIRASPTMPPWRANIPAWPLRSARITSKPLIVA